MTEPETEAQTLDRLEAALARIATHAPTATHRASSKPPPDPSIIEALDTMIAHLRAATQPRQEG